MPSKTLLLDGPALAGCLLSASLLLSSSEPTTPTSQVPSDTVIVEDLTETPEPELPVEVPGEFDDLPRLEGTAKVEMILSIGDTEQPIVMELDGNDAPITAGNFVDLVQRGFYDGLAFHRVVRDPEPFVVQAGDPQSLDPNFPMERLGTGKFIDPDTGEERFIPLEIKDASTQQIVYGVPFQAAGIPGTPVLAHKRGAVAMARSQVPDSASSQFYIALSDLGFLDGNYAVFGYVPQQYMNVVDEIQQGDRIISAEVIEGLENLKAPE